MRLAAALLPSCAILAAAACAPDLRHLEHHRYDSRAMGVPVEYAVLTPPGFRSGEELPLVVFLHGGGDDERSLEDEGVAARLVRAMARGDVPRAVVLAPDGDFGFWTDWHDGSRRYETWLLDELIPRVQREYGTRPCPDGCHLMGVSMGGSGALRIALHHPGRFASLSILSAPTLDTDAMIAFAHNRLFAIVVPMHRVFGPAEPRDRPRIARSDPFVQWRSPEDLQGTHLFLAWAEHDAPVIRRTNAHLARHLDRHQIPHVRREFDGEHGWSSWTPVLLDTLRLQLGPDG